MELIRDTPEMGAVESGTPVVEDCLKMGIAEPIFY